MIAKDARENLGGLDVVASARCLLARGVQCYLVVAIVPDRDGKDFVPSQVILDVTQNYMVASVNRLSLISSLEGHLPEFRSLAPSCRSPNLAKYCQKEWLGEEMDQAVAEMKRALN